MKRATFISCALIGAFAINATAQAQVSVFKYEPAKVPQGKALHYRKTMLDGSRATNVSVYVVDAERLESLKWDQGATEATLVKARMDWKHFSVREFESLHLERGQAPQSRATLTATPDGKQLNVSFATAPVKLSHWPWHSYDFDFASLNLTLPHLRDPHADVIFWRTDVVFAGESMKFAEIGGVRMHFEAMELRNEQQVRRYSIGGAGLEFRYGNLWTNATTGLILEYQLPIGDEPGFKDVRLVLDRVQPMSVAEWEAFKKASVGESVAARAGGR